MLAYRTAKARHPTFAGTGAEIHGGRWNSPGRRVIYCSDSFAGTILEIIAHARPRRLPGRHRCVRIRIPEEIAVEVVEEAELPGWDAADLLVSRRVGDHWLEEERSAVLSVPSVVARPFGRTLLINPTHPAFPRITTESAVEVVWDPRLFWR
jgi:RES domain-containing protein